MANNLECEPDRRIKARDNAAFGVEPQGKGWRIEGHNGPAAADLAGNACKRPQYGGIVATPADRPRNLTQSCLHRLVIRTAAALWRNPGDVAVGVLDVAGFAMDAVLGVDLEARA